MFKAGRKLLKCRSKFGSVLFIMGIVLTASADLFEKLWTIQALLWNTFFLVPNRNRTSSTVTFHKMNNQKRTRRREKEGKKATKQVTTPLLHKILKLNDDREIILGPYLDGAVNIYWLNAQL